MPKGQSADRKQRRLGVCAAKNAPNSVGRKRRPTNSSKKDYQPELEGIEEDAVQYDSEGREIVRRRAAEYLRPSRSSGVPSVNQSSKCDDSLENGIIEEEKPQRSHAGGGVGTTRPKVVVPDEEEEKAWYNGNSFSCRQCGVTSMALSWLRQHLFKQHGCRSSIDYNLVRSEANYTCQICEEQVENVFYLFYSLVLLPPWIRPLGRRAWVGKPSMRNI